jgi:hypothetical protein
MIADNLSAQQASPTVFCAPSFFSSLYIPVCVRWSVVLFLASLPRTSCLSGFSFELCAAHAILILPAPCWLKGKRKGDQETNMQVPPSQSTSGTEEVQGMNAQLSQGGTTSVHCALTIYFFLLSLLQLPLFSEA